MKTIRHFLLTATAALLRKALSADLLAGAHLTSLVGFLFLLSVAPFVHGQVTITNATFDSPNTGNYTYTAPTGWTASGYTGVSNGTWFGSGFGVVGGSTGQFVFLQSGSGPSSISQNVTFPTAGTYQLTYTLAGRASDSGGNGDCSYTTTIGSGGSILSVSGNTTSNQPFTAQSHTFTVASAGAYALTFTNTTPSGLDAFYVDTVAITSVVSAPTVTTSPASGVANTSATLNGIVSANGASTTVTFQYGTTTSYGQTATATQSPVSGTSDTAVSAVISGLLANTTYHYRVVGANSSGTSTGSNQTFATDGPPAAGDFKILTLTANNYTAIEVGGTTGDDRGGIALSPTRVFLTGDNATGSFARADLSGGAQTSQKDALCANLADDTVYVLADGSGQFVRGIHNTGVTQLTRLIQVDGSTGALTGMSVTLSTPIMGWGSTQRGIFSGYNRVVVLVGGIAFQIALPGGTVTNLGSVTLPVYNSTENDYGPFGVAERFAGADWLAYGTNTAIMRTRIGSSATQTIASFLGGLQDLASFTISPVNNRWYFHYEGSSGHFGSRDETLGFADATFSIVPVTTAPTLTSVSTLTGASEDTPFTISYATLAAAADEADANGDEISFRVEAVSSGTLTKGGSAVVPGATLLSTGENWVWTPTANANGTLAAFTVRAYDGALASAAAVQVNVSVAAVNDAPTFTSVNTLTGATEDTAFTISYATLAAAADEADIDSGTLSFRVEAVSSGTLTKGGSAVVPGTTLLSTGENWVWTPAANANGTLAAFTVRAYDGALASATAVQVNVSVAALNDAPTLTSVSTLTGATEDTAFSISYATLAAAADEADIDSGTLSFRVEAVSSGTLTKGGSAVVPGTTLLSTGETWVLTPAENANGTLAAFTVRVWDGALASASAVQVHVSVTAVNDVPTLTVTTAATTRVVNWTATTAMSQARFLHTGTLLSNGKVLVAGGVSYTTGTLATAALYDPATGMWTATANNLSTSRDAHTATLLDNGQVLIAGGASSGNPLGSAMLYNPVTNSFSATGTMTTPRRMHTATMLADGRVLVAGGVTTGGAGTASAEIYDPSTQTWSAAGALGATRCYHAAALLDDGRVLVAGGAPSNTTTYLDSAEIYNPATNAWTVTASLPQARAELTLTPLANGKVLLAGGTNNTYPAAALLFDPTAGSWTATGSLAAGRYRHRATLLPTGQVLVTGGATTGAYVTASNELYDPATGTWTSGGTFASARRWQSAVALADGRVLVTGGDSLGGTLASAEIGTVLMAHSSVPEGAAALVTGTFFDPDGNATVTLTASSGIVTQNNVAGTWSWSPAAGFDGPSAQTVTITATDAADATATTGFAFAPTNAKPTVAVSRPASAPTGMPVDFTFTATDASTADQSAGFAWNINYGDSTPAVTRPAGTASPLVLSHTFARPGTYTVRATATDKDGGVSTVASAAITLTGLPLSLVADNQTRAYGAANPTFTGTISGVQGGDVVTAVWTTSATATSAAGTTHPISYASLSGADAHKYFVQVNQTGTLTITQATTTTSVASKNIIATPGAQTVQLTGAVSVNGGSVTVQVKNGGTNVGSAVTASVPQSGLFSVNYTLPAGTGAGAYSITASYSGTTNHAASTGTGTLTVIPPPAVAALVVSGFPNPATAGTAGSFTVRAYDSFGATMPSYTGTVAFSSSDVTAALPTSYTFVPGDNGVKTFSATLRRAGTQTITVADGANAVTGTQSGIVVNAGVGSSGQLYTWGFNGNAQLGVGDTATRFTRTAVSGFGGATAAAAGLFVSVAVAPDGGVWSWGVGPVGDGSTSQSAIPVRVKGPGGMGNLSGITAVAAGSRHRIALKDDGTVWAWGSYSGDGTTANRLTPVQVQNLSGVIAIAAGDTHSMALKSDGTVWTWGSGTYGQLGDGLTAQKTTPVQVVGLGGSGSLTGITSIACGRYHSLARKNDGSVWAWGRNGSGQLGDGTTTLRTTPVQVSGLSGIASVAAGGEHSLALSSSGSVYTWGNNQVGQLGDGTTVQGLVPGLVANVGGEGTAVVGLIGGSFFSVARVSDGTLWAWGVNFGLGTGSQNASFTPVKVTGFASASVLGMSGTGQHVLAVDGSTTATQFLVTAPTSVAAGTPFDVTVRAVDVEGNSVAHVGTVRFTSNDALAGLPTHYTFVAGDGGEKTFSVTLNTAGTRRVTVADATSKTLSGAANVEVQAGGSMTITETVAAAFNAADQFVTVTARVTGSGTVSQGVVTFQMKTSGGADIGAPVFAAVSNGVATASYVVPGGTPAAIYPIHASYSGGASFAASSGSGGNLRLGQAPTNMQTIASAATAPYSLASQSVTLSAAVISSAGTVNEGTIVFRVLDSGGEVIETATTSAPLTTGAGSVSYLLPAALQAGEYTIETSYSGGVNFEASASNATLTVMPAFSTIATTQAQADYSAAAQTVTLNATVTSAAGIVNEGVVEFQVKTMGGANVGAAVTSEMVTDGEASVIYTLPAGTPEGDYTIVAHYIGAPNLADSSDETQTLMVLFLPETTITEVPAKAVNASAAAQSVTLEVTVSVQSSGPVNEGTVTFRVLHEGDEVGTPVTSGTLSGGAASANYTLPAGTAAGEYTIEASYSGSANYVTSSALGTLTVRGLPTVAVDGGGGVGLPKVLVLAGGVTFETPLQANLAATGLFSVVDFFNGGTATPTLEVLNGYDAVILTSNGYYLDDIAIGNVLADYLDAGHGVVTSSYSASADLVRGRFLSGNYAALASSSYSFGSTSLVKDFPDDPIFLGVATMTASIHDGILASGATQLAHFSDGKVAVAVKGRVVGLGFATFVTYASGDYVRLAANALVKVAVSAVNTAAPEGSLATQTGTFSDPDGNATVTLSASTGTITQDNAAGTWNWSKTGIDGPASETVTITATDVTDATATDSFTFTVTNVVPTLEITAPETALAGELVDFAFTATDPSAIDQAAGFMFEISYGDGFLQEPGDTQLLPSPRLRGHVFASPGSYTVTCTATDQDGGVSLLASKMITILSPEIVLHNGSHSLAPELSDGQFSVVSFGSTAPNVASLRNFTVRNTGDADLHVTSVTVPSGYITNAASTTLAPGTSYGFQVSLDSATPATYPGNVVIVSDDLDEHAFDFPVTGTVVAAGGAPVVTIGSEVTGPGGTGSAVLGGPVGSTLYNLIGSPAINSSGVLASAVQIRHADASLHTGMMVGQPMVLIATDTQTAPSLPGVTHFNFAPPIINETGHIAFIGEVRGTGVTANSNSRCLFSNASDGTLKLVARTGTNVGLTSNLKTIGNFSIGGDLIIFLGTLVDNSIVLFGWDANTGIRPLMRNGQSLDANGVTKTVKSFNILETGNASSGHGKEISVAPTGESLVTLGVVFTDNSSGVVLGSFDGTSDTGFGATYGASQQLADTYAAPAVIPLAMWSSFRSPGFDNTGSYYGFISQMVTNTLAGVTSTNNVGVFVDTAPGILTLQLRENDVATGTGGLVFSDFSDLVLGGGDYEFLVKGEVRGSGVVVNVNDKGLWAQHATNGLVLVAREGSEAPGVAGSTFFRLTQLALPGTAQPMFQASMKTGVGGVTTANDTGLWVINEGGEVKLAVREGDVLDVAGTDRTVTAITALLNGTTTGGALGRRVFLADGQLTLLLTFSGGIQANAKVVVP